MDCPPIPRDLSAPNGRPKSVLVVDDSEHARRAIRLALESLASFRVCGEAANGREAVSEAILRHPDLIVMDLAMPMMNGVEAAMALRGAVPRIPIILLSMYGEQLREAVPPCYGVTQVLSKADGVAGLMRAVNSLFPGLAGGADIVATELPA